jgi:hypothetical protein
MAHNYHTCGGPRRCDYCAAILIETPAEAVARLTAEEGERAADRRARLAQNFEPPDGYAIALAKRSTT